MKALKLFPLFCFFSLVFYSCKKTDISSNNTDAGSGTSTVNKILLLQLVNDSRQKGCTCGSTYMPPVPAVNWNDQLTTAADVHSKDMLQNNYFSHTGADGSSPGDRIRQAGYNWRAYGENIAKGYQDEQSVMTAWLQSEDHCKNIMGKDFTEMGVARAGSYWTQEFGTK